jgi:hypothetical protein
MGKGKYTTLRYSQIVRRRKMRLDIFKIWRYPKQMKSIHIEDGEERQCTSMPRIKKVVIASISGVKRFSTFRIRGVLQGQRVTVLIDGGASHNFIDLP